ncbi:MAG: hypothetical protein P8011_03910 [Acidihalobacter sp.]|uniref:hypothetical protein n=1 Tax=Acidihalobacter sp. TaxID=1872108 RepID=UPI00307ECA9F
MNSERTFACRAGAVENGLQPPGSCRRIASAAVFGTASQVNSSIYNVPIGAATVADKSGSAWGFAFSLNLKCAGLTPNDMTTSLQMQDMVNGTTGNVDALAIPDNYGYSSSGRDGGSASNPLNSSVDYRVQNAEAFSYASVAGAFGDPGYDMNQNDVYKSTFSATCITDSCAGRSLVSVSSTVIAGTGVPVPEPPDIGIFGTGLLALLGQGLAGRRRVCHRYA